MNFTNLNIHFTESQKITSFNLVQQELQKEKFFIGRLSGNETRLCGLFINNKNITKDLYQYMLFGAGIQFKTIDDELQYVNMYNISVQNTSLLGIWDGVMYNQAKDYYDYLNNIKLNKICAHGLEPYNFMNDPTYKSIPHKKILIITSHKQTTLSQLSQLDKLYNKPIFNNAEFYIYKPAQQNAGSHDENSWQVHYNNMKQELDDIKKTFNFDIALVSAGGFGMLLCNYIYTELNTSTIYVGGALQLFFGIIGKRWINNNINEFWVKPVTEDKPLNTMLCEGSCYW
jgi:hypothetical protein